MYRDIYQSSRLIEQAISNKTGEVGVLSLDFPTNAAAGDRPILEAQVHSI
jgi:hypothetical protein